MNKFAVARFANDPILASLPIAVYTCPLRFQVRPQSFSHLHCLTLRSNSGTAIAHLQHGDAEAVRGAGRVFALVRQNAGGGSGGPPPEKF